MKIIILIVLDLVFNLKFVFFDKRVRLFIICMKNNFMYMFLNVYKIKIVVFIV